MGTMRTYALLTAQGTACFETALTGSEYTPDWRSYIERVYCDGSTPDGPVAGTWTDVTDNDAFG